MSRMAEQYPSQRMKRQSSQAEAAQDSVSSVRFTEDGWLGRIDCGELDLGRNLQHARLRSVGGVMLISYSQTTLTRQMMGEGFVIPN